ncbi:MAG: hypothetical protein GX489_08945, partial [Firmicutes bacterium]|nr:hypothetical protein [Bacillota bacterium]
MIYMKKTIAFILSLLLLTTIVQPLPARAAGGPVITRITPDKIKSGESVRLYIYGLGLSNVTEAFAGGKALTELSDRSDTQVSFLIPQGVLTNPGKVDIMVKTNEGQTFTLPGALTVLSAPEITKAYRSGLEQSNMEYHLVPTFGGYPIVVEGKQFQPGLKLFIGEQEIKDIRVSTKEGSEGITEIAAIAPRSTVGGKEIKVINPDGQQALLAANAATTLRYRISQPIITDVFPNYGSTIGETLVTITGDEFDTADRVRVQMGLGFAHIKSVSADHKTIVISTPPGNVGQSDIIIANADLAQATGEFEYIITPTISYISPNYGPTSGGTCVTIRGTNFPPKDRVGVRIGGQDLDEIEWNSDTEIIVTTKNGPPGLVAVEVYDKNDSKKSYVKLNGFTFKEKTSQPTIDKITPNVGHVDGGDEIVITGGDFLAGNETNPTRVLIDGQDCTDVLVESVNQIRAITPAGQAGWRSVEVINPDGGKVKTNYGFQYKIPDKLLLITGVTSNRGPIDENKYVVISGANFLEPDERPDNNRIKTVEVLFGGNLGYKPVILDSRTISVTTPLGGALGAQTVVVRITRTEEIEDENGNPHEIEIYESAELPAGYIYEPPKRTPIVESVVNPKTKTAEGPLAGGVEVYVYGHYFETRQESLPEVYFGDLKPENKAEVRYVGIQDPDEHKHGEDTVPLMYIEALIPPAKAPGMVPVWVVNPALEEGQTPAAGVLEKGFTYRGNLLHLMAVTPNRGPIGGGTVIEITGKNFDWSQDEDIRKKETMVFVGLEPAEIRSIEIKKQDVDIIKAITPSGKVGLQDIRVVNPFGEASLNAAFYYYDKLSQPLIENVAPNFGSSKGGTVLTLVGIGFASGAKVYVGKNQALQVDVTNLLDQNGDPVIDKNSNQIMKVITCLTPAGEPGPAQIKVVNVDGGEGIIEGKFIYLSAPEITSVTPASGTVKGGTWVILKGKDFLDPAEVEGYIKELNEVGEDDEDLKLVVKFGSQEAEQVTFLSSTEIALKTPVGPYMDKNAVVDVELINPDAFLDRDNKDSQAGHAIKAKGYEYRVPTTYPDIKMIDPNIGPVTGGTKVLITGSDFRQDAAVFFKWEAAAKVTRIDYNTLEVVTPPAPENWVDEKDGVDVIVINTKDGGQSQPKKFRYVRPQTQPEFHSIVPNQGSVDGDTLVTIRGYGLGNIEDKEEAGIELIWPTVYFGNDKATVVGLNESRTMLRVKTPPHAAGTVDIRIVNPDSATVTANNAYTYRYITTEPHIQNVEPKMGRASGGTPVVIVGSGFSTGAKVFFNDQAAKVDTAKSSETTLFVYSPPGKAGEKADITVLNPDGASHTLTEAFEYLPDPKLQPRITQIIPNKGPITGGTVVDIWGVNLRHGTNQQLTVLLGHQPVEVVNSFPDSDPNKAKEDYVQYVQIEIPPAEKPGSVDVSVINADGGVATVPNGFTYTDVVEPIELDAIVPSKGPYLVNIPAQINGSGFLSGAKVFLGGQEIAGCEVINEGTAIIFTIPAAPEREDDLSLDVVVMNPNGATARLKDGFTYVAEPKSEPKITQVVPGSGRAAGGTPVAVYGQGFIEQTLADGSKELPALFFGSRLAAKTIFVSGEQLSA